MPVLTAAFPTLVPAQNVLETGFAGLNMMIHFPLVLGNIGWCDRLEERGEPVPLYLKGMTRHLSNLIEAQDMERSRLCAAFGAPWKSLAGYLGDLYGAEGETALEAVASSRYYRELPPYPAAAWRRWMSWDIPHAHVPLIALADLSGVDVPLHRAAVSLCSAFLQSDFAAEGVTIQRLGLDGLSVTQVLEYVETGRRADPRRRTEARALA
jgi:opine dehydrogenase